MHTLRDYSIPLLLAFAVHAAVALALSQGWKPPPVEPEVMKPNIVAAALLVLERPKPAPRSAPAPAPKPEPTPVRPPAEVPKPKVDPLAEQRRREEAERKRQREEADRKRQREEEARQKRLDALADRAFEEALEREIMDLGQDAAESAALTYIDGIYSAVVANWSRPPSARNDMEARLRVELIPTGEVVSVTVLSSSGNAAFDRSAEAAVRKARRFVVPSETRLFEQQFRSFVLLFKPQDLLR